MLVLKPSKTGSTCPNLTIRPASCDEMANGNAAMSDFNYPNFTPQLGYMTEKTQRDYIKHAIQSGVLPANANRLQEVVSLEAPNDPAKPIQFWQIFSVLGPQPIVEIVKTFYEKVFWDEEWFREVFAKVGNLEHHVATQASMWADVMGAGHYYHGAEFRLNFHHHHNAMALMNDKGAKRWAELMRKTLDERHDVMTDDPRIRRSINTFLTFFFKKYADDFAFKPEFDFGPTNPALAFKVNFLNMTEAQINALGIDDLRAGLESRGLVVEKSADKEALVSKALML